MLAHEGRIVACGHNRRVQQGSAIRHGEMDALEALGRRPGNYYRGVTLYTTLSPCAVPRVVIGENRSFLGEEALLRARGVTVEVRDNAACRALMAHFIAEHPDLWHEDIGDV